MTAPARLVATHGAGPELGRRCRDLLGEPSWEDGAVSVWCSPHAPTAVPGGMWAWAGPPAGWTADGRAVAPDRPPGPTRDDPLDGACPPAAAVWAGHGELRAATDPVGLSHLFRWHGDGQHLVASSGSLVGRLVGATPDESRVAVMAVLGHPLFEDSAFDDVVKLAPGERVAVDEHGIVTDRPQPERASALDERGLDEVAAAGATALTEAVSAALHAHPDAAVELSGGLDSRAVLAAVPADRRVGRWALTVGEPGEPNVEIARRIADAHGLRHQACSRAGLVRLGDDEALALVRTAAARRDWTGNALAWAVNDWGEARLPQGPRLSGQGGEVAQGVYHRGQRPAPAPDRARVEALCRWRLLTNERADERLFADPDSVVRAEEEVATEVLRFVSSTGLDWLASLDELYLALRMPRWAGLEYSMGATRHPVLVPFLHPAHVAWARSVPPDLRRNRRATAAVLCALDADLAGRRLDRGGLSPRGLAGRSAAARARVAADLAGRGLRKAGQRVRRRGKPPALAQALRARVVAGLRSEGEALAAVAALPWVSERYLTEVAEGRAEPDVATTALIVNLAGLLGATPPGG